MHSLLTSRLHIRYGELTAATASAQFSLQMYAISTAILCGVGSSNMHYTYQKEHDPTTNLVPSGQLIEADQTEFGAVHSNRLS